MPMMHPQVIFNLLGRTEMGADINAFFILLRPMNCANQG
jgi:hypothetical protein